MSDMVCRKSMMRCQTPGMCSPHGGCRDEVTTAKDRQISALIAENERLKNRLEVDPRHDYDGISTRDATVKVLDEQVDQLKAENELIQRGGESLKDEVKQLRAEIAGLKTGYEAYERVNAELKAEVEGLRKDADRAAYWKQRAKSAEGHLFSGDFRAAAMELHKYSRFESTPWPELTGSQHALISSAAGAVIATVNRLRDARRPKNRDETDAIIWCACGDGHAVNSYGAGFMDANDGVCENCDAANLCASQSTSAKISDALGRHKGEIAAERDAVKREGLVEAQKACDRIAGDSAGRSDRERKGAGECSAAIRALIVAMSKESGQ